MLEEGGENPEYSSRQKRALRVRRDAVVNTRVNGKDLRIVYIVSLRSARNVLEMCVLRVAEKKTVLEMKFAIACICTQWDAISIYTAVSQTRTKRFRGFLTLGLRGSLCQMLHLQVFSGRDEVWSEHRHSHEGASVEPHIRRGRLPVFIAAHVLAITHEHGY